MRKIVGIGLAALAISCMAAFGVAAQTPADQPAAAPAAAARPPEVLNTITDFATVDAATVNACTQNGVLKSDRGLLNTSTFLVECVYRTAAHGNYPPEVHPGQDQVYYITKGEATLLYGGHVVGTELVDAKSVHLVAGDVTVLPAGQPDQWKIPNEVGFLLVRRKP